MPPRRGFNFVWVCFYKYAAPTALETDCGCWPSGKTLPVGAKQLIYGIRSKVVHGDELGKELEKVQSISVDADEIARRIMRKISSKPEITEQFHMSKSDLEEFFLKESFGGTA
jgi:hypothetical protein